MGRRTVFCVLAVVACSGEATNESGAAGASAGAESSAGAGGSGAPAGTGGASAVAECESFSGFEDPVLDSLVRAELSVGADDALTGEMLATLTRLEYVRGEAGEPIRSLAGAECLAGLEMLILDARHVEDEENDVISDVSPLAGLSELRELAIQGASFDLAPLGSLVQLEMLKLDYSVPGTMEAPGSLDALAPLVNLTYLDASDGCVEDISALSGMTALRTLDLYSNCVRDLSPLEGLSALELVDLTDNYYECADVSASFSVLRGFGATVHEDCSGTGGGGGL